METARSRSSRATRPSARALHVGHVAHAWSSNLVTGVTKGFEKKLEITGVGYRAAVQGKNLQLRSATATTSSIRSRRASRSRRRSRPRSSISGIDKQQVGQVAAEIRVPPPEPYKGKGVKYAGEFIFRKEGKKK
jgi:large subunit ribosomal protein L6